MPNREQEPPKSGQPIDRSSQTVDMARHLRTTEWRQAALLNVNK